MSTESFSIRTASPEDAGTILAIYAPYVERTAITFEYDVPTEEEMRCRINRTLQSYPYLIAERNGRAVGYTYAGPFIPRAAYSWSAELSIYLDMNCRRQGIGRALYLEMERILSEMGIRNLEACIAQTDCPDETLDNASPEFHAHMGYRLVGKFRSCGCKFGRWYDMIWMEKIIGDHLPNPDPIRPFQSDAASDEAASAENPE